MSSVVQHSLMQRSSSTLTGGGQIRLPPLGSIGTAAGHLTPMVIRGGIKNAEGPLGGSTNGLLSSLHQGSASYTASGLFSPPSASVHAPEASSGGEPKFYDEEVLELMSAEMSFSALYLHELHRRRLRQPYVEIQSPDEAQARARVRQPYVESPDEAQARAWQTPESPGVRPTAPMPNIQEAVEEDASPRLLQPSGDEYQLFFEPVARSVDI